MPNANYCPLWKKIKIKYSNNIYLDTVQNIWNTRNGLFLSKESLKSTLSPYRLLGRTPFLMQSRERDHFECRHDSNVPSQTVWTELYCVLLWLCFSFPRLSLFPSCTFFHVFSISTFLLFGSEFANVNNRSNVRKPKTLISSH